VKKTTMSSAVKVCGADCDLIPVDVFHHLFGCSPQDKGFSVVQVARYSGVLVYASNWNPPPGCDRISNEDVCMAVCSAI
jgi:hypothetical protein